MLEALRSPALRFVFWVIMALGCAYAVYLIGAIHRAVIVAVVAAVASGYWAWEAWRDWRGRGGR
jgi:hypothetical protein